MAWILYPASPLFIACIAGCVLGLQGMSASTVILIASYLDLPRAEVIWAEQVRLLFPAGKQPIITLLFRATHLY